MGAYMDSELVKPLTNDLLLNQKQQRTNMLYSAKKILSAVRVSDKHGLKLLKTGVMYLVYDADTYYHNNH